MFKKTLSGLMALLIIVAMAISVFGTIVFAADYATYDLALTIDKATGNAVLKVTLPAGVASGKIVIQTTDKLTLVDGSLASSISETKYEDYDREGIEGLSVTFAKNGTYDAGTEVLTVSFTVNCAADAVTVDDFNAVLWNLSNGSVRLATDADGDVNKTITVIENYTVTFTVSIHRSSFRRYVPDAG